MNPNEPEYITVGQILNTWGINGQIKVAPTTDFPERFHPEARLYINQQPVTIERAEWHKGNVIIKLGGIDRIEDAQKLRGQALEIHRSQLQALAEEEYYLFQIVGLEVWTTGEERLGIITGVEKSASNDIYIVSDNGKDILIPAIGEVIVSVDIEERRLVIAPMPGLLELNETKPKGKPAPPG